MQKLGKNENLYISRPDKGNGIVILNRSDYISKVTTVLSDSTKFISLDENSYKLTQRLESRLNKTLLAFYKSNKLDKITAPRQKRARQKRADKSAQTKARTDKCAQDKCAQSKARTHGRKSSK